MGFRALTPIILIILSLVIVFTYIKPTFESMQVKQEQAKEYQDALETAASFNDEVQRLLREVRSFEPENIRALERYVPDEIDSVAVMRDIDFLARQNSLALTSIATGGSAENGNERSATVQRAQIGGDTTLPNGTQSQSTIPRSQSFSLSVDGSYENLKNFLIDVERNAYPLAVADLSFGEPDEETGLFTFSLTLETYALNPLEQ